MNYKLLTFAQKSVRKCHFWCLKFMQNFHFLILCFMAKRDPDLLNILYFACCYVTFHICDYNIHLTIYLTILSGCYFLTSCRISAKSSTIFFKKGENQIISKLLYLECILVLISKKHIWFNVSHLVFWSILLFCTVFVKKKILSKNFFAYFCHFLCKFWSQLAQTLLPT